MLLLLHGGEELSLVRSAHPGLFVHLDLDIPYVVLVDALESAFGDGTCALDKRWMQKLIRLIDLKKGSAVLC